MSTCLSELALDNLILNGPGNDQRAAAHLDGCEACQRRREQRLAVIDEAERSLGGAFWREVRRQHERHRAHWRPKLILAPALALAGGALLLLLTLRKADLSGVYTGAKGAGTLEVHCHRAGATFALSPQDAVRPGDELRFVPHPAAAEAHYVQVASIDGTGRYAPFYPPFSEGASVALPPKGQALDGSIRLDAAPGPERLFFVFSSRPLPVSAVQRAAEAQVAKLSRSPAIDGVDVESGWIVLPKLDGQARP